MKRKSVLILCTGNSCRSQMAEAILKSFAPELDVFSAGTEPSESVHPKAVEVMQEIGIDIRAAKPTSVSAFIDQPFDAVVTVCSHAKETCPIFTGCVQSRYHIGFDDPATFQGTESEITNEFRRVRDEIFAQFKKFYQTTLDVGTQSC
ncbi:protein tyrosine phosphatase [Chloroherpeton thalassium ATCC 35110]|uniref:Protein tyrosine phosphatase n=1 Tax=Chloroherpeton thalassium (strain ATCC 35110 / GB-78) TaxID=517418 RepID=B3QYW2_CHLT3|nr:arsenate reductase ArsC [Chloroherpeton thalassium]ACF13655.1 protein tyrosine phosphatase [Chloroherpeton thalassium ATCC 35110]